MLRLQAGVASSGPTCSTYPTLRYPSSLCSNSSGNAHSKPVPFAGSVLTGGCNPDWLLPSGLQVWDVSLAMLFRLDATACLLNWQCSLLCLDENVQILDWLLCMMISARVGKGLCMLPSRPALDEPQGFSWQMPPKQHIQITRQSVQFSCQVRRYYNTHWLSLSQACTEHWISC